MAWTMSVTLAERREVALYQLVGIGRQLDSEGIPSGPIRAARVSAMCYTVDYGRSQGVHYDGGPWADFVAFVNP